MRKTIIASLAAALGVAALAPATASAEGSEGAAPTLAEVLLSDSAGDVNGFDHNWHDYDIVTQAVLLFPDLVDAASNPDAELTAFLPNDRAFRKLVKDITDMRPHTEQETFDAVASLGVDTVKAVLTYHLVGAKIPFSAALQSDGAALTMLSGGTVEVDVRGKKWWQRIILIDADTNDRNPRVIQPDIGGEASNGFAHGIDRVLRPIDLP
jgi:uncharacterized surface protein with fasciclin (FAS1) repeats